MAYSIVDGVVREAATRKDKDSPKRPGKVVEKVKQGHGAGVRVAQDRGKPAAGITTKPTARRVIALDFEGATPFEIKIDADAAMNDDLTAAISAEETARLRARTPAEVAVDHPPLSGRARQVDYAFTGNDGEKFPAGSWVALFDDGREENFSDTEYRRLTNQPTGKTKPNSRTED